MKEYEIQKNSNIEEYSFVIFSTSYVSPIERLREIEKELNSLFEGKVLFDLLLSNGVSSNRYVEAFFNGHNFEYTSFKSLSNVKIELKKESTNFYRNHSELLKNSVLPNAYQYLIKKGKVL